MSDLTHTILLKWVSCQATEPWMYVDINDFRRYPDTTGYVRYLDKEALRRNKKKYYHAALKLSFR